MTCRVRCVRWPRHLELMTQQLTEQRRLLPSEMNTGRRSTRRSLHCSWQLPSTRATKWWCIGVSMNMCVGTCIGIMASVSQHPSQAAAPHIAACQVTGATPADEQPSVQLCDGDATVQLRDGDATVQLRVDAARIQLREGAAIPTKHPKQPATSPAAVELISWPQSPCFDPTLHFDRRQAA